MKRIKEEIKRYGHCFEDGRLMPAEYLIPIEYVEGHLASGEIHHKLICKGCIEKADQLGEVFKKDKKI